MFETLAAAAVMVRAVPRTLLNSKPMFVVLAEFRVSVALTVWSLLKPTRVEAVGLIVRLLNVLVPVTVNEPPELGFHVMS